MKRKISVSRHHHHHHQCLAGIRNGNTCILKFKKKIPQCFEKKKEESNKENKNTIKTYDAICLVPHNLQTTSRTMNRFIAG